MWGEFVLCSPDSTLSATDFITKSSMTLKAKFPQANTPVKLLCPMTAKAVSTERSHFFFVTGQNSLHKVSTHVGQKWIQSLRPWLQHTMRYGGKVLSLHGPRRRWVTGTKLSLSRGRLKKQTQEQGCHRETQGHSLPWSWLSGISRGLQAACTKTYNVPSFGQQVLIRTKSCWKI